MAEQRSARTKVRKTSAADSMQDSVDGTKKVQVTKTKSDKLVEDGGEGEAEDETKQESKEKEKDATMEVDERTSAWQALKSVVFLGVPQCLNEFLKVPRERGYGTRGLDVCGYSLQ